MAQDITSFYTAAQAKDFARQNQFRILDWTIKGINLVESDLVYMESASIPGRAITNQPVNFMGLQFNVPGNATYPNSDGWSVTFRCPQSYDLRTKLENATRIVFNDQDSTGNYNIGTPASLLTLGLLDKQLATIKTYKLFGAYVVNLGEIAYNVGDAGSIVTFPATVAYHYWLSNQ